MTGGVVFANDIELTTVGSSGVSVPAPGTQETWQVNVQRGAAVSIIAGTWFHIADPSSATAKLEKVKVIDTTAGSTIQVIRGDEGTAPVSHAPGATFKGVVTAGDYASLPDLPTPLGAAEGGSGLSSYIPYAVLLGGTGTTTPLQQVADLGNNGDVLTSGGPGVPPSFLPPAGGGGGGGGITRMPWNILGGWAGSTFDLAANSGGGTSFPFIVGSILVVAVVADTTTPFNSVGCFVQSPQSSTGSILQVLSATGSLLATGTNTDTVFNQPGFVSDLYYITLNATITPSAAQTIYYVAGLIPFGQAGGPGLVCGGETNWEADQTKVSHISEGSTSVTTHTTIPNPLVFSTLDGPAPSMPFFVLK